MINIPKEALKVAISALFTEYTLGDINVLQLQEKIREAIDNE